MRRRKEKSSWDLRDKFADIETGFENQSAIAGKTEHRYSGAVSPNGQCAAVLYHSTTAAVIALLHTVRKMLSTDQYVHVFSFDFTKAFDTVRHVTLMNKVAQLNIPDNIYNWIKAFFEQHFHCTRYAGECSTVAAVKASVIQGSGLGPASFIVTAADLHPTTPGNRIFKFADDTYLVVPSANSSSRLGEAVEAWASRKLM